MSRSERWLDKFAVWEMLIISVLFAASAALCLASGKTTAAAILDGFAFVCWVCQYIGLKYIFPGGTFGRMVV